MKSVNQMARMHSRKHGKSGSKKPVRREKPKWVKYSKQEVEKLIVKLAKEGQSSSQIGITLRDQYGIPRIREIVPTGTVSVMDENKLSKALPEDMHNLIKKAARVRDHLEKNKKDSAAIHGVELINSKIRRLSKFYKRQGRLPQEWKYDPEQAKLLIRN